MSLHPASKRLTDLKRRLKQSILLIRVLVNEFHDFFFWLIAGISLSAFLLHSFYPKADLPHHHMTWMEAVYYTWMMMFFESPLNYVEDWRFSWLFFFLPLLGLVTIAEGVVHLGNLLFQHKRHSAEWQKMIAATMENHIIVCGLGNVGVRVTQHLRSFKEPIVVIEHIAENRFINEVASYDVPVLIGDGRDAKMLESANVAKAKAIIAVTDNDLANLEAALTAREYNPDIRVVIRMFDQKLAKKIEKSLGIEGAYSSSARSSRLFAQAAISPDILDSFEFGGTVINAMQLLIEAHTALVGQTIDELRQQNEVTVLMHEKIDGEVDWNPPPNNVLAVGDKLLIMTDREGIERVHKSAKKLPVPRSGAFED